MQKGPGTRPKHVYTPAELLALRDSPLSQGCPQGLTQLFDHMRNQGHQPPERTPDKGSVKVRARA